MQQVQQRETGERISWARALIFGVGFFFLATFLIGQLPSYVNLVMTSASLVDFEQTMLALAYVSIGGFLIIQVIVMLFDPKPVLPPALFSVLGIIVAAAGTALTIWASVTTNHTFPNFAPHTAGWNSIWGGEVLWFPAGSVNLIALGATMAFVGLAWLFYSILAFGEQTNPDRRDPGTTLGIRLLIAIATGMLIVFMLFFAFVSPDGLAKAINPHDPGVALLWVNTVYNLFLAGAIICTLGAFALRLHYLMRPVRKNTMKALYAVGFNLAQVGVVCLGAWFLIYPFIYWLHFLPGLGPFFTVCARKSAIPLSCGFSQEGGDLIGATVTMGGFSLLIAAAFFWKTRRNLVVIGGVTITALLALSTLLTHIDYGKEAVSAYQATIAMMLCAGGLILATIWTSVARREFAVVGEKPLGCLGMWLVMGTCLLIYIAAFAFFSIPGFRDTETNIPFYAGLLLHGKITDTTAPHFDAVLVVLLIGALAAIQFYFLMRNRYRV
jgi:hypothetical protein